MGFTSDAAREVTSSPLGSLKAKASASAKPWKLAGWRSRWKAPYVIEQDSPAEMPSVPAKSGGVQAPQTSRASVGQRSFSPITVNATARFVQFRRS